MLSYIYNQSEILMFRKVINFTSNSLRIVHFNSTLNIPKINNIRFTFTSSSNPSQVALMQQVQGKVFQVLRSAAKCDQKKLNRAATFQQLGFDSLDSVQLIVAMQEYFGFDIPNQQAQKIQTVEAAVNTFFRHLNSQIANKVVQKDQSQIQNEKK